jgi:hypothetical protein
MKLFEIQSILNLLVLYICIIGEICKNVVISIFSVEVGEIVYFHHGIVTTCCNEKHISWQIIKSMYNDY